MKMVVSLSSMPLDQTQNMEWCKAQQQFAFSVDLGQAAKQQLRFLSAVDNMGCLYEGPAVERAIYRYKYCWLPLLAKHMEAPILKGPMVVSLDCEWIWHCHRLNPVQYKRDCEKMFGKLIGNENVLSTLEETSTKQTESAWKQFYENEPYHLDLQKAQNSHDDGLHFHAKDEKITIHYDLAAAVKRQSSFFSKASDLMNQEDSFFQASVDRYKSLLYLIKTSDEKHSSCTFVPTHDIDLIWHSHQLNPIAYSKDLSPVFGGTLDHNDRDSKPDKLFHGFGRTEQIWELTYGCRYSKEREVAAACYTVCFAGNGLGTGN